MNDSPRFLLEYESNAFILWKDGELTFKIEIKKTEENYNKIVEFLDFIDLKYIDMINAYDYDNGWHL